MLHNKTDSVVLFLMEIQGDAEEGFTYTGKGFWFSSVNWAVICRLLWQRLSEPQAFWI